MFLEYKDYQRKTMHSNLWVIRLPEKKKILFDAGRREFLKVKTYPISVTNIKKYLYESKINLTPRMVLKYLTRCRELYHDVFRPEMIVDQSIFSQRPEITGESHYYDQLWYPDIYVSGDESHDNDIMDLYSKYDFLLRTPNNIKNLQKESWEPLQCLLFHKEKPYDPYGLEESESSSEKEDEKYEPKKEFCHSKLSQQNLRCDREEILENNSNGIIFKKEKESLDLSEASEDEKDPLNVQEVKKTILKRKRARSFTDTWNKFKDALEEDADDEDSLENF